MGSLSEHSIPVIEWVQKTFSSWESSMLVLSHVGDPKNAFSLYFPLMFGISATIGREVLFGAVAAEWFNIVFKWMLFGERPYWWVRENLHDSEIKQFKLTCETGPGSPSGHVMVTAVVYYIMLKALNKNLTRSLKTWLPLLIFMTMASAIGISRVFIAAHFPHQILGGFVAAYIIGHLMEHVYQHSYSFITYILTALFLFGGAIGLNNFLHLMNIDLNWSVELAIKHCAEKSWISLNTTPYNSIIRVSSALLGYGIAEQFLNKKFTLNDVPNSFIVKLTTVFMNLCICTTLENVPLPSSFLLFYFTSSLKYILISISVVHIVPLVLSPLYNMAIFNKNKID